MTLRDVSEGSLHHITIKAPAHLCLLQHYLQLLGYGNNQDAPLLMNGLKKCGIYIPWNFIETQRRMKFCHLHLNGWNWRTSF
jgi:hypothetical protein